MHRLHEGFVLGKRYVLVRKIAAGGMGQVWEADDSKLSRRVAVKVMHPDTADEIVFARRFRDEAMHTAGLSHLNIATLFDYGEDDGLAYLVMELVPGEPLSAILSREGALAPGRVRSIVVQAALALGVAHEAGIIHRDVKPANILVTTDGTAKLTDFGISRSVDGVDRTRTGEVFGTPFYMSPEQALGEPATAASDIYALGVVAHEMLTGRRPFDKGTPVATALAQVHEPPPPLPAGLPEDMVAIIDQCLVKEPQLRPASARAVAVSLGYPVLESIRAVVGEDLVAGERVPLVAGPGMSLPLAEGSPSVTMPASGLSERPTRQRRRAAGSDARHADTTRSTSPSTGKATMVHWVWIPATALVSAFAAVLVMTLTHL